MLARSTPSGFDIKAIVVAIARCVLGNHVAETLDGRNMMNANAVPAMPCPISPTMRLRGFGRNELKEATIYDQQ
jgi:hypothetical protein